MIRRALAAVLAALVAAAPAGADFAQPIGDSRLSALAQRYFNDTWRLDPERATRVGNHDLDDRLGSYDAASYAERLDTARKYLDQLHAIDPATMGAEGAYDERILEAALERSILQLDVLQPWHHRASSYTDIASNAIYSLISRNFAPLPQRMKSVVARERQIPALLTAGLANITTVDATTAQIDRGQIAGTIGFFTRVVPKAFATVKDSDLQRRLAASNSLVLTALDTYLSALDAGAFAHPSGTFAIGSDHFAELLRLQELTPIPLATYERVGDDALAKTKADFVATAKQIDPNATPQAVVAELETHHPSADLLLKKAAGDLRSLRAFVVAHKIVTLPADDDVSVVATPEFARETTFASMDSPGPLETVATEAYYYVTPVEPAWTPERQAQHLSFFNDYAFPLISAHEVMPGHYVNFAIAKHERLSLIRRLLSSPSFAEGWAHYDEQMMVDEGWGGGDPKVRLAQLQLALQRECRYLVGLREHTDNMTIDEGQKFFEDNAFMGAEPSHREALRGAVDPLYGYYTLGKLELLKLREDFRKASGSKYSLETFHDQLLSHGDPPFAIARKIVLGAEDDGQLL